MICKKNDVGNQTRICDLNETYLTEETHCIVINHLERPNIVICDHASLGGMWLYTLIMHEKREQLDGR